MSLGDVLFDHPYRDRSEPFAAPDRIERPLPRLLADEEALTRAGPENRPARCDIEIFAPLPEDLGDLRLGRFAHVEDGDRVAIRLRLRGEGRHQRTGADPAGPREDLMSRDLDDTPIPGLEVEHGGRGGEGVAIDQEFAAVRRPEGGPEFAHASSL